MQDWTEGEVSSVSLSALNSGWSFRIILSWGKCEAVFVVGHSQDESVTVTI